MERNKKGVGETASLAVGRIGKNVRKYYLNRTMNSGNGKGGAAEPLSNSARASDRIKKNMQGSYFRMWLSR